MSYDIYLRGPRCKECNRPLDSGPTPDLPDPTYNLTPIFDLALSGEPLPSSELSEFDVVILGKQTERPRGLRLLNGRRAGDTIEWLRKALTHLANPTMREQFVALEPSNKWGTLEDAIYVLDKLKVAAEEYPDLVWEIR